MGLDIEAMRLRFRFLQRIDRHEDGCWGWRGAIGTNGYGYFNLGQRGNRMLAHRYAHEAFIGPITDGLEIDHLCRNRSCVNPAHLEAVSHRENTLRGTAGDIGRSQTHCKHGHPFDDENTYIRPTGQRDCRACILERGRRSKAQRRVSA